MFDVAVASAVLLVFGPLMLLIAAGIWLGDRGPIFFGQHRIGMNGRKFRCLKFRSMAVDAERRLAELLATDPLAREEWHRLHKLTRDPRITPIGRFLRLSSLDELPQLINVLRGEMSIVGPRPIVQEECARYGRYIADYCRVRPGLTGMWQVSGRNDTSYRRRVALDVCYCRNFSLFMDMKILLLTVPAVVKAHGVY